LEQLKSELKKLNHKTVLHSYNKSKGENELKQKLTELSGSEVVSSYILDNNKKFEIDCLIRSMNFGIEYCGEYWHSYPKIENKKYHQNKTILANSNNIRLMTIFESEWLNKKEIILSMISSRLGFNNKIMARKCYVREITGSEARIFHNANHMAGYTNSSVNLGLFCNKTGILYSVLSLSKSRFDKKYQYEITRFSTLLNFNVIGGFGKLLGVFIKSYNPKSILTYADLRFGFGEVYCKNGFRKISITPPNYWYYNKNKPIGLESRMKYQKSKLKKMYPGEIGTELDIMTNNGYYRIYDCGSVKYEWRG